MGNVRKHRDIKHVTTEVRMIWYQTQTIMQKSFPRKMFYPQKPKSTQIFINKLGYLALSILEISKIVMYGFWYDHLKPKHGEKAQFCYMDTGIFIVQINTVNIYSDIAKGVETRLNTSNYELGII